MSTPEIEPPAQRVERLRSELQGAQDAYDTFWSQLTQGGAASDFEGEKGDQIREYADSLVRRRAELESELRRAEVDLKAREGA